MAIVISYDIIFNKCWANRSLIWKRFGQRGVFGVARTTPLSLFILNCESCFALLP